MLRGTNAPPQHITSKVSLVTSRTTGSTQHCLRQEKSRKWMGAPLHSFLTAPPRFEPTYRLTRQYILGKKGTGK